MLSQEIFNAHCVHTNFPSYISGKKYKLKFEDT